MKKYLFVSTTLVAIVFLMSSVNAQSTKEINISLSLQNATLNDALREIEKVTPFRFQSNAKDIETVDNINIQARDQSVDYVLREILAPHGLTYSQTGAIVIIKKVRSVSNQSKLSNNTIHGIVKVKSTGETVIGASIVVPQLQIGTTTNSYGFFSLTMPRGNYSIVISAVGMTAREFPVDITTDSQREFIVEEDTAHLDEVTVTATLQAGKNKGAQMGVEKLNVKDTRNLPVIFGERDILKSIQLLPGIKQAAEGNSGFYVRGGAADQNLILLDEAPVYNPSHLLGFFSTFNSDAIKSVTLYKGGMPPQYGGRLSSVVDVKMNDGNNQAYSVSGGIGLIASRLNIEGPIQKDKSSFLVSGRRTYADLFLKLLGDSSLRTTRLNFYDLNAKSNFVLGKKDKLYISGYFGRDVLGQEKLAGINWGNATATMRWNHVFNSKLFSNASFIFSNYDYRIRINSESTDYDILSRIRDWSFKHEMQWYTSNAGTFDFGLNATHHTIKPGEITVVGDIGTTKQGQPDRYSFESALFAGHKWSSGERWNVAYGLRLSFFTILGEGDFYAIDESGKITDTFHYGRRDLVKTYVNAEPRLSIGYELNNHLSLKASYTRNVQNLHLLSNSTAGSPTDKWVASSNIIKPEIADQVAIGWYNVRDRYEISTEIYYKNMFNQIDYRNGAKVFSNDPVETQLLFGKGRAYGVEWLLKKTSGRFTGWVSYTLSKTERKINGINNNDWYNARQDRTHDVALVGIYQANKKWTLSATWVYYTGDAVTYPSGKYTLDNNVYFYYSERNGYRMPDYHRLDLSATKQLRKTKRYSSELSISLFNAYGRANAYRITFRQSDEDPSITEAVQTSLFTFVPSISWNFKF